LTRSGSIPAAVAALQITVCNLTPGAG
jgi:hypothetical protein